MKNFKELAEARRAVNYFDKERKITDAEIREIIEVGALAPSAFNLQPWRVIIVRSEDAKDKLMALANGQPKIKDSSATLIIVGDRNGYSEESPVWKELTELVGEESAKGAMGAAAYLYGSSEERKIKFAESNGGLLAMSIMYAAKGMGIDSHPMSGMDFDGIKKAFELKESEAPVMAIALGYFDESKQLYPRRKRTSFEDMTVMV